MISELSKLKHELSKDDRVVLLGPSGVGKSYIGAQLRATSLDKFGSGKTGKWIIDPIQVAKLKGVVEGTGDNVEEWLKAFKPTIVVLITTSNFNMFRMLQTLKFSRYEGKHENWRRGWFDKALMSDARVKTYLNAKLTLYRKFVPEGVDVIIYDNKQLAEMPTAGWHGSKT